MMNDKLLTAEQVAEMLGFTVGTIYNLVSQGRIPYIKLSKRALRFRADEIDKWIKEKSQEERTTA